MFIPTGIERASCKLTALRALGRDSSTLPKEPTCATGCNETAILRRAVAYPVASTRTTHDCVPHLAACMTSTCILFDRSSVRHLSMGRFAKNDSSNDEKQGKWTSEKKKKKRRNASCHRMQTTERAKISFLLYPPEIRRHNRFASRFLLLTGILYEREKKFF